MDKTRLGSGLSALFRSKENSNSFQYIKIEDLSANPLQPRKNFDSEDLESLSKSISIHGVLQPLLVREINGINEIIAGERRFRASQKAGLKELPCWVVSIDDNKAFEASIIENVQREGLNPIEEAEAYHVLINKFGCKQSELAERLGINRVRIAHYLQFRKLPLEVQEKLAKNEISVGHAKILANIENPIELTNQIIKNKLSVRNLEKRKELANALINLKKAKNTANIENKKISLEGISVKNIDNNLKDKPNNQAKNTANQSKNIATKSIKMQDKSRLIELLNYVTGKQCDIEFLENNIKIFINFNDLKDLDEFLDKLIKNIR